MYTYTHAHTLTLNCWLFDIPLLEALSQSLLEQGKVPSATFHHHVARYRVCKAGVRGSLKISLIPITFPEDTHVTPPCVHMRKQAQK
jgi:hypothetical protein